mmetsp:Transcript_21592/g.84002  ORF Transcript_21592/g.84002 Transcript_21592/m.84002 type:complete len:313 (-) Transcript_21592:29-967(-)
MFPFRFSFGAPPGSQAAPQAAPHAPAGGSRYFCHECSRTSQQAAMTESEAAQRIPQCSHCGSEFLEELEDEPQAQQQQQRPQQAPPLFSAGAPPNVFAILNQMQQQMQQQFQAARFPPPPQQEGPQGGEQQPPALEAIFRSLMQMHGQVGMQAAPNFPGLYNGPGNGSFQDILDHLFQQSEHKGPPPTDKEVIAALPRREVEAGEVREGYECAVCQDAFESGSQVIQLPCSHDFHVDCILPWIEHRNTCPTCRYEMKPQEDAPAPRPQQRPAQAGPAPTTAQSAPMQDGVWVPRDGDSDTEMLDEAYAHMYQ